jgi:DNA-binding beta-propeller fold protein YncE
VGAEPEHVEITPDGRWIVVARPEAGELALLDVKSLTTVRTIAVGGEPHQIVFAPGR